MFTKKKKAFACVPRSHRSSWRCFCILFSLVRNLRLDLQPAGSLIVRWFVDNIPVCTTGADVLGELKDVFVASKN